MYNYYVNVLYNVLLFLINHVVGGEDEMTQVGATPNLDLKCKKKKVTLT